MEFKKRVWQKCKLIPKGKVTTYKELAKAINTKAYRAVGNALKRNPFAPIVPCHRVVKSDGKLGGYHGKPNSEKKAKLLIKEGVEVNSNRINLKKYMFKF